MENNMNHCMLWLAGGLVLGGVIGGVVGYNMGYSAGQANHASDLAVGTEEKFKAFVLNLGDETFKNNKDYLTSIKYIPKP